MQSNCSSSTPRRCDRPAWRTAASMSAVALFAGVGTVLAAAAPASAASSAAASASAAALPSLTGVVRVELESPDNSAVAKTVTVACPAGTRVINAGGYLTGAGGSVALDDIYPDDLLSQVEVTGKETDTYSADWRVTAFATCADEPPGLEWIWAESVQDSSNSEKPVVAQCSAGKTLLGTGATIRGGQGEAVINEVNPNGGPGVPADEVEAVGVEVDPFAGDWTVSALAICAEPLAGQQVVTAQTAPLSINNGTRADCGAGQVATGSGGAVLGGGTGEVVLDDAYPTDGSPTTPPTATTVYGQEEDGTVNTWTVRAYVVCADA